MELIALPAFNDNYLWLLHDGQQALVVDPGDAAPVRAALERLGLRLASILVTHHHADHTGGVAELRAETGAQVFGPARERIPEPYTPLQCGDVVQTLGVSFRVIDVPGHTAGHIAYFADDVAGAPLLFCGDTLFSGGCGRLFEGTPAQMKSSLDKLAALPDDSLVGAKVAHEGVTPGKLAPQVSKKGETYYTFTLEVPQNYPVPSSQLAKEQLIKGGYKLAEVLKAIYG